LAYGLYSGWLGSAARILGDERVEYASLTSSHTDTPFNTA